MTIDVMRATARLILRGRLERARALDMLCAATMAARGVGALDATAIAQLDARLDDALELEREIAMLAGGIDVHGHCGQ